MRFNRQVALALASLMLLAPSASLVMANTQPYGTSPYANPYGYVSGNPGSSTVASATTNTTTPSVYSYSYPTTTAATMSPYASSATGVNASPYSGSTTSAPNYNYSATNTGSTYGTTAGYAATPSTPYGDPVFRAGISTIPRGTIILSRLDSPISSYSSNVGDPVSATVETDIYNGSELVIPAGSSILGNVTGSDKAGFVGKAGKLSMQFTVIRRPDGSTVPFQGHVVTEDNSGVFKGDSNQNRIISTAVPAVGGAAAGTILGTATGSLLGATGAGAAFGLAVGSIAGVGYALVRKGKQVAIPSGARLSIMVDQSAGLN